MRLFYLVGFYFCTYMVFITCISQNILYVFQIHITKSVSLDILFYKDFSEMAPGMLYDIYKKQLFFVCYLPKYPRQPRIASVISHQNIHNSYIEYRTGKSTRIRDRIILYITNNATSVLCIWIWD